MLAKLFAIATIVLTSTAYPMYKQCDSRWSKNSFGTTGTVTMCRGACLISCVAMVLADCGKTIGKDKEVVNPGNLNTWL